MLRLSSRHELLPLRRGRNYFDTDLRYRARREFRAGLAIVVHARPSSDPAAPEASEWRRLGSAFTWDDALQLVRQHRLDRDRDHDSTSSSVDLRSAGNRTATTDDAAQARRDSCDDIDLTDGAWAERPLRRTEAP